MVTQSTVSENVPVTRTAPEFRPAGWLPGPHLQTIWGRVGRIRKLLPLRREPLVTPDGDELLLDHQDGDGLPGPRFLLFHGLEGSSHSVYIQGLLRELGTRGLPATVMNLRSCARDRRTNRQIVNRRPRLYHSGETADPDFVIRTLAARHPGEPLIAIGVSVGGNILLKWLGENPGQTLVARAATLSVPYDLAAGARKLETGIGLIYTREFLKTLRGKVLGLLERFPERSGGLDVPRLKRARTFYDFDDAATAPLHGFAGAEDYYTRCSSFHHAGKITTPVTCLSAADDPFLPEEVLPRFREAASSAVELIVTPRGGHVGFVAGPPWRPEYWAERFLVERLGAETGDRRRQDGR